MKLTIHHVREATPENRRRLAKALGLRSNATIVAIVASCNSPHLAALCRWPCLPIDGAQCPRCAGLWKGAA